VLLRNSSGGASVTDFTQRVRPYVPFSALNTVLRKLDKNAKTILDVGCGKGTPMYFINKNRKFKAVGIDIFKPYLDEARGKEIYQCLILGDVSYLPFKDKSFDVIICMEVLEHFEKEDGEKVLDELERVGRSQILLTTPIRRYKQDPYDGNPNQEHRYIWQMGQLKEQGYKLKGAGILGILRLGINSSSFRLLRDILYSLGGVFSYNFPKIAFRVVAEKKLKSGCPKGAAVVDK